MTVGSQYCGGSSADFSCAANTCGVDENTGLLFQALLFKIEKPKLIETMCWLEIVIETNYNDYINEWQEALNINLKKTLLKLKEKKVYPD